MSANTRLKILLLPLLFSSLIGCNLSQNGSASMPATSTGAPATAPPTNTASPTTPPTQAPTVTTAPTATIAATATSPQLTPVAQQPPVVGPPACTLRTDWPVYTVAVGDTLGRLATATNSTIGALAAANCLANANIIHVGQALRVPRVPATSTPVTLPEVWLTQGTVHISSYLNADAGNFQLQPGETITLRWDGAPEGLISATFYLISGGQRQQIGRDIDPNDGFAIAWVVPASLGGELLMIEGSAMNAAAFDYARTLAVSHVYAGT
ncbi:MAG: LysM peptidoglycan-binding domain-containing protein [Anaerolineae bacterium]|nr:LysM peptidoglycan-binding domain-containing protein [Anaerolineae bacterium]